VPTDWEGDIMVAEQTEHAMTSIFHLAYNVTDLAAARAFYGGVLGCAEGRSAETWVDFDFFGHQISLHLGEPFKVAATGNVAGHKVAMPHLGVILEMDAWKALASKLEAAGTQFILAPHIRWPGEPGEQATMFFNDPCGNPIEIKGHADMGTVFAT
jgi:extradiol dioxygenase family protein